MHRLLWLTLALWSTLCNHHPCHAIVEFTTCTSLYRAFSPRDAMHSADSAVTRYVCLSVRLSVCPSHAGIPSKRLNLSSNFFHQHHTSFYTPNGVAILRQGPPPLTGCRMQGVWINRDFQPISRLSQKRYKIRYGHSYYGMRIGNLTQTIEWYNFNDFEWP